MGSRMGKKKTWGQRLMKLKREAAVSLRGSRPAGAVEGEAQQTWLEPQEAVLPWVRPGEGWRAGCDAGRPFGGL